MLISHWMVKTKQNKNNFWVHSERGDSGREEKEGMEGLLYRRMLANNCRRNGRISHHYTSLGVLTRASRDDHWDLKPLGKSCWEQIVKRSQDNTMQLISTIKEKKRYYLQYGEPVDDPCNHGIKHNIIIGPNQHCRPTWYSGKFTTLPMQWTFSK